MNILTPGQVEACAAEWARCHSSGDALDHAMEWSERLIETVKFLMNGDGMLDWLFSECHTVWMAHSTCIETVLYWIHVKESGMFLARGTPGDIKDKEFPTLADAKAWCEANEAKLKGGA